MALVFRHAQWPQDTKLRIHEYSIDLATCTNTTSMVLDIHKMKKKKNTTQLTHLERVPQIGSFTSVGRSLHVQAL